MGVAHWHIMLALPAHVGSSPVDLKYVPVFWIEVLFFVNDHRPKVDIWFK
jgi:hypothetical protein